MVYLALGRGSEAMLPSRATAGGSRPQREFLQNVLNDLNQMLAHFIRAQLTLAALTLVVYSLALWIMGIQYSLVLGTLGGCLSLFRLWARWWLESSSLA